MTRPWLDEGPRVLPNALFHKFSNEFRVLKRDFDAAVATFARNYPQYVAERKKKINGLFKESDYPAARDIKSRFNMDLTILPVPDVEDFRSDLDDETMADIRDEIQKSTVKRFRPCDASDGRTDLGSRRAHCGALEGLQCGRGGRRALQVFPGLAL